MRVGFAVKVESVYCGAQWRWDCHTRRELRAATNFGFVLASEFCDIMRCLFHAWARRLCGSASLLRESTRLRTCVVDCVPDAACSTPRDLSDVRGSFLGPCSRRLRGAAGALKQCLCELARPE